MFLGRLFMEHYIIDHMLLEDKLKEISVKKWCVGLNSNERSLIFTMNFTGKILSFLEWEELFTLIL